MRIGKRTLRALWDGERGKAGACIWDEELRGFGVRWAIGGFGFVLKYRVKGQARQHFVSLGMWPAVSPDAAREAAREIKEAAALGRDLLAERKAAQEKAAAEKAEAVRQSRPVAGLLDAWRTATDAQVAEKCEAGESATYERELLRLEAKILRPAIGGHGVGDLTGELLQALIEAQTSASTAGNLRSLIVQFVRLSRAQLALEGIKVSWPVFYELTQSRRSRTDYYTLGEAARIWIAAGGMGRRGALIRFLLLTGGRKTETAGARWAAVDFDDPILGPYWRLKGRQTKNNLPHRVPLSPPAVALLRWLPPRESRRFGRSDLIFAGRGNRQVGGWTDLCRVMLKGAGLEEGTFHDFRRTIVTTLGDHGFDAEVADKLLNHSAANTMSGVMAVYQRSEMWKKRREAIELWSSLLMGEVARITGKPEPEAWGFDEAFVDVRIKRPPRSQTRTGSRPSVTGRIAAASQDSRSAGR